MPLAITALQNEPVSNPDSQLVSIVASGNYTTDGDTLDMTPSKILDPSGVGVTGPNMKPKAVEIVEENIGGNYAQVVEGASFNDWKVIFYAPGGAQIAQAGYPAAISGGTIKARIVYDQNDR